MPASRLARRRPRSRRRRTPAERRTAGIAGFGRALPATVVDNAPIAARIGVEPAWITKRTGISARRRSADGEGLTELAIEAGGRALAAAGVDADRVDAVLVATSSADDIVPQAAPIVAGALGADRAMAWDVGLACTGFLAGLQQGAALIESGRATTSCSSAPTSSRATPIPTTARRRRCSATARRPRCSCPTRRRGQHRPGRASAARPQRDVLYIDRADDARADGRPLRLPARGRPHGARLPRAAGDLPSSHRRHRPRHRPPGQRADHQRRPRALRPRPGPRRRLRRRPRQHLCRLDPAGPLAGRRTTAGCPSRATSC